MFLRNEIKQKQVGELLVPFCKDCNSQDIETIQICKKCGSHNITSDWTDKRSTRPEFKEYELHIYKCDKCGKEFDMLSSDKFIHFDGEFYPFKGNEEEYPEEVKNYTLDLDLCINCKEKLVSILNKKLNKFISKENVLSELDNLDNKEN